MMGDKDIDNSLEDEDDFEDSTEDTVVMSDDDDDGDDNVDLTSELNVEELVAKLEATDSDDLARRRLIRRRLEELRELREAEMDLDSTYNFNLDDDD